MQSTASPIDVTTQVMMISVSSLADSAKPSQNTVVYDIGAKVIKGVSDKYLGTIVSVYEKEMPPLVLACLGL